MVRKIVKIDEEKCDGCGLCADACHEGAIEIVGGKARLIKDDYCDGLGDCLPACPAGAISFEEREAARYDEQAVHARLKAKKAPRASVPPGCPGSRAGLLSHNNSPGKRGIKSGLPETNDSETQSRLGQWPVQLRLVPVHAPYFANADLLIAADCSAFARRDFHDRFMKNRITLIGCPKLDPVDYSEKLAEILKNNEIKSITVVRMEVPCCGGIVEAVKKALQKSGKIIPWRIITLSVNGDILEE
ncbi:4Fe-4S binding protein [Brucepastera parasyntrophica]|uniref:ATP-binding protein n=1 Tax=Brucepastera parasyntrophica TaxID=2880008 RepID=UPI00210880AD|nr:4Fe-4S binding protein [Brucepastera parasyntrophica]ULQ60721.1 4Fe-4S binding protein [Brucepastera parasyntrophica]